MKWVKNGTASANRRYGVMVAAWWALGWSRLAFPADPIVPGNAARQLLSASEEGGGNSPPLRLKLTQLIGASPAAVSAEATVASEGFARSSPSALEGGGSTQPLRLKLTQA